MAEIKFPPLLEQLRRRFQADVTPTLGETVSPVVVLEGEKQERLIFGAVTLCYQFQQIIANDTQVHHIGLWNPSNDVVMVVERVWGDMLYNAAVQQALEPPAVRRMLSTAGTSLHLAANVRDFRQDNSSSSRQGIGQIRTLNDVTPNGTLLGISRGVVFATTSAGSRTSFDIDFRDPFILAGNSGLWIAASGLAAPTNRYTRANFMWRERAASAWEKTPFV